MKKGYERVIDRLLRPIFKKCSIPETEWETLSLSEQRMGWTQSQSYVEARLRKERRLYVIDYKASIGPIPNDREVHRWKALDYPTQVETEEIEQIGKIPFRQRNEIYFIMSERRSYIRRKLEEKGMPFIENRMGEEKKDGFIHFETEPIIIKEDQSG